MIYSLLRVVTEPIDLALRLPYIDGLPKLNYGRNLWFAYVADVQPLSGISVRFMEAVPGSPLLATTLVRHSTTQLGELSAHLCGDNTLSKP